MSLTALRRSSRALTLGLLVVSLWGLPHRGETGDACPPPGAEQHDESRHVFSADGPDDHGGHCAVCHWLRSLNPDLTHRIANDRQPDLASGLPPAADRSHRDGASRQVPARGPPSFVN
jgi:hypothetical protein